MVPMIMIALMVIWRCMTDMNKLNRRGYVLVEIILASVIAFGIAYYMLDLTIKLKNKNDDLLAKTLVKTDRAIIQNKLYQYILADEALYDKWVENPSGLCNYVKNAITINNNVIKYNNELVDIVNKYTEIGPIREDSCAFSDDSIRILIHITVEPLNQSFDVILDYVLKAPILDK